MSDSEHLLSELIALLPQRLQPVAKARWVECQPTKQIAVQFGLSRIEVYQRLSEADYLTERRLQPATN
jgi:DNA-directed RNA polymerase specialized sigma subunit